MPILRRDLLRASLAGGSALLVAGCGDDEGGDDEVATTKTGGDADIAILGSLLDLERASIAGYQAGLRRASGRGRVAIRRFLWHERAHADVLSQAIADLGGTPSEVAPPVDVPALRGQEDALRHAVDLDLTAIAAYIDALPKLTTGELRQSVAAILTAEAEHVAVLHGLLGERRLSGALVKGGRSKA